MKKISNLTKNQKEYINLKIEKIKYKKNLIKWKKYYYSFNKKKNQQKNSKKGKKEELKHIQITINNEEIIHQKAVNIKNRIKMKK